MIETRVEGDPAEVRAAARWLRTSLATQVDLAGDSQVAARGVASSGWEGRAAEAYQDFSRSVLSGTDTHAGRVRRAATACEAFATRLEQARTAMAGLRSRARNGGLDVSGTVIVAPASVPPGMVEVGSPEEAARRDAIARIELYNALADEASAGHESLAQWVESRMPADVSDARETDGLDELTDVAAGWAQNAGAGMAGLALQRIARDLRAEGLAYRRKVRWSGNPAYRPPHDPEDLLSRARLLGRWGGRLLGPVGIGIDVFFGIQEARETGDWGRAATTTGTSIVVGGLVTAGIIALGGPAILAVGGGALVAYGASQLAGYVWDHKDEIADWAGDRWDEATDLAADTWEGAQDLASDTWDAVTPW